MIPKETPAWLVKTNFALMNVGVICMISGLGLFFTQTATIEQLIPLITVGELAIVSGFVSFAAAVFLSLKLRASRRPSLAPAT